MFVLRVYCLFSLSSYSANFVLGRFDLLVYFLFPFFLHPAWGSSHSLVLIIPTSGHLVGSSQSSGCSSFIYFLLCRRLGQVRIAISFDLLAVVSSLLFLTPQAEVLGSAVVYHYHDCYCYYYLFTQEGRGQPGCIISILSSMLILAPPGSWIG